MTEPTIPLAVLASELQLPSTVSVPEVLAEVRRLMWRSGRYAESLAARMLGGELVPKNNNHGHDLVVHHAGVPVTVEVKSANASTPNRRSTAQSWQFGNIYGGKSPKDFDFLLLIGLYPGKAERCFLVPRDKVQDFVNADGRVRVHTELPRWFGGAGGSGSKQAYQCFQVDWDEAKRRIRAHAETMRPVHAPSLESLPAK